MTNIKRKKKTAICMVLVQILYVYILLTFLLSCKKENSRGSNENYSTNFISEYDEQNDTFVSYSDEILDGNYCADVEYYNPSTGTRNTYELNVEVEDGYLVQINWPNDGWLDETHFSSKDISSGECSFISDKGYRYTITLGEKGGGCYNEGARLQSNVNDDTENTTCPKCGNDKSEYDDYCDDCQSDFEGQKDEEEL